MKFNIVPYKMYSKSAKVLARALNVKRIKDSNRVLKHSLVNWGNSKLSLVTQGRVFNLPGMVGRASNKIKFFEVCLNGNFKTPPWFTSKEGVEEYYNRNKTIFCRTTVTGNSAQGIVLANKRKGTPIVDAPLYTVYVPGKEYRVHVINSKVVDVRQKKKKEDADVYDDEIYIKNHGRGYVFAMQDVELPDIILDECVNLIGHLGLDFGAIDLKYDWNNSNYYMLEVNTAPGLVGTTLDVYKNGLEEMVNEQM